MGSFVNRPSKSGEAMGGRGMSRVSTTFLWAAGGAALGVASAFLMDDPYSGGWYVPRTTPGWIAYYVAYAAPWTLIGAVIGFFNGKRVTAK